MAITELTKNKKYQLRVAYRDGLGRPRDRKKTINGTFKDAIVEEQKILDEINQGITSEMTFIDLFNAYHNSKPNVISETKRKEVEIFNKYLLEISRYKIENINPYQVITLRNSIEQMEGSITQKNKSIYLIKSIYKFGSRAFGFKNVADSIEIIKPKVSDKFVYNTVSPEEFEFIISFEKIEVYKLIYEIYFWAGLRRGEAIALFKNDLLKTKELDIYNSISHGNIIGPPKNEQSYRRVGIHQDLYNRLLPHANSKGKYLLGGITNLAPNTINRRFNECQKKANEVLQLKGRNPLPHLRIHDLRHSHATFLASQGVPVTAVSHRLGHASIGETMNTYLHLFKGDDVRALAAIDKYLEPNNSSQQTVTISGDITDRVKSVIKGETFKDIEDTFTSILDEMKSSVSF